MMPTTASWTPVLVLILSIFTVNLIWANQDVNLDELKKQLPPGVLPEGFQNVSLPVEKALDVVKNKCNKESGSDAAFEEAQQATTKMYECLSGLMNWTALQEEIEHAKPTGDLETVFNKYCRRRNSAIDCVGNFSQSMSPCLSEKENRDKVVFTDIVSNLLNFVCHKDGDQIALFIAEKGPECFTDKKDEMIVCLNSTFGSYLPDDLDTTNLENNALPEMPSLTIGPEQCEKMDELQKCIVAVLEKCEETTPANLVESAFKFIRQETPCKNMTSKFDAQKRNGAITLKQLSGLMTFALASSALLLV